MTGKWSQPGVPQKGWTCTYEEDLGEPAATCEMCETTEIRFVHHMEHPDYPDVLECGCICAGHMEQDLVRARSRETRMVNAARRRSKWLTRAGWQVSASGNPYINAHGYNVVVFRAGAAWRFRVQKRESDDPPLLARKDYPSQDAARLRAFDAVEWMRARE